MESAQCNVGNDLVLKWNTSAPALCWTGKRKVESAVFNENFYSISYKKRIFTADKSPKKVTANLSDSKALNSAVSCNQLILLSPMSLYLQAKHIIIIFDWVPSLSLENVASDSFPVFGASDQISTFHFWSNRMKWKHSNVEDSSLSMEHRNLFLTKPTEKSHQKRLKITWWLHTVPEKIANYSWNLDCKVPFFSEQKQRSSATNVLTCKTM